MGVHGLTAILRRYAPNAVKTVSSSAFAQKSIAIDASCHLNKFIYGDETHIHRHIYGFYQLARFCSLNSIRPIFVFDGPQRLEAKQLEHAKRARTRRKVKHSLLFEKKQSLRLDSWLQMSDQYEQASLTQERAAAILNELKETLDRAEVSIDAANNETVAPSPKQAEIEQKLTAIAQELRHAVLTAEDTEKYTKTVRDLANRERALVSDMLTHQFSQTKSALQQLRKENQSMLSSLEKRSYRITQAMREECQMFLKTLGYVCFSCDNHEAEAMCANLARMGRTSATVSEDLDTIAFGDAPILRYFFSKGRPIMSIDPVVARAELGLSRESFIDLCILCGTDFSGTIQGIGPHRALQAIQKYGTIEELIKNLEPRYVPHDTFNYSLARQVFNDLPPIPIEDAAYEPQETSELVKYEMLRHYEIDPLEADASIQTTMLRQNIIDASNWGTDPFASNPAALNVNAMLLGQLTD